MKKSFFTALLILSAILQAQINHELLWKFETDGKIISSPVIKGGILYFGSDDFNFYSVSASSGTLIWKFKTGGIIRGGAALFDNKIAFVSGDGFLYVLSIETGELVWKFETRGEKEYDCWDYYFSTPAIAGDILTFGSGDSYIYGLNKNSGEKVWEVKTGEVVHSSPAVADSNIYVGSFDGNLYSINALNGKVNWKFKTIGNYGYKKGEIQGSASVLEGFLVFGSRDFNLYAVEMKTGTGAFNEKIESWIVSRPVVYNKAIYFGNSDQTSLRALHPYRNGKDWKTPVNLNVFADALIYKNYVLFGSFNGRLYFTDRETGEIIYIFSTDASTLNYSKIFDENDNTKKELHENLKTVADYCRLYNETYFSMGSIVGTPCSDGENIFIPSAEGAVYAIKIIEAAD